MGRPPGQGGRALLRTAGQVSAQWCLPAPHPAALTVSLVLTVLGTGLTETVLDALSVPDTGTTRVLVPALGALLGVAANWLIFAWAIARLPRIHARAHGVARAALLGAVGLEVLKQSAAVYLEEVTGSLSGAVFGSLIGLLLFTYLVARLLLLTTAWAATASGNARVDPVAVPAPATIRQEVVVLLTTLLPTVRPR